jgi:hypothetical protein
MCPAPVVPYELTERFLDKKIVETEYKYEADKLQILR